MAWLSILALSPAKRIRITCVPRAWFATSWENSRALVWTRWLLAG
jgi:hypothetical protein